MLQVFLRTFAMTYLTVNIFSYLESLSDLLASLKCNACSCFRQGPQGGGFARQSVSFSVTNTETTLGTSCSIFYIVEHFVTI